MIGEHPEKGHYLITLITKHVFQKGHACKHIPLSSRSRVQEEHEVLMPSVPKNCTFILMHAHPY